MPNKMQELLGFCPVCHAPLPLVETDYIPDPDDAFAEEEDCYVLTDHTSGGEVHCTGSGRRPTSFYDFYEEEEWPDNDELSHQMWGKDWR